MKVLIIGGTGLISRGIVKHLLARGAHVTMYNRARRDNPLSPNVELITGDRSQRDEFEGRFANSRFDVVIDMICFRPEEAESDVRAFGGRCEQLQFCSSVAAYGVKISSDVLVDETFPQEPVSTYGKGKVACEEVLMRADAERKFRTTIFPAQQHLRPGPSLDRPARARPGGLGPRGARTARSSALTAACRSGNRHIATTAGRPSLTERSTPRPTARPTTPRTTASSPGATTTARLGSALDKPIELLTMPAGWIVQQDPARFSFLRDISRFHGAYSSAKAKRDIPEFRCEIDFTAGARDALQDLRRRKAFRDGQNDDVYQKMVDHAAQLGSRVE